MFRLLLILLVAASLAGCTKAQAKTPVPPPPLTTPDPPGRVIVPASIPEPEPVPAAAPPPVAPPAPTTRSAPAPARGTPPPAPAPAAPVVEPPTSPPILQTTSNPAEVEQRALALINTAERDLERINSAQLTSNALAQYETAKGFILQAKDALKVKNVVLARELADKAAALASQLRR